MKVPKEFYNVDSGDAIELDEKDKKIIEELQINARKSISQIARDTGIRRDVVKYRIKRLEENNVIRFYHAFVNPAKLGRPVYTYVLFTLTNLDPEKENKFIAYLTERSEVTYVAKISGKWDFAINICSKDINEFDSVLREIRSDFADIIKDFDRGIAVQEYKYDYMADLI